MYDSTRDVRGIPHDQEKHYKTILKQHRQFSFLENCSTMTKEFALTADIFALVIMKLSGFFHCVDFSRNCSRAKASPQTNLAVGGQRHFLKA